MTDLGTEKTGALDLLRRALDAPLAEFRDGQWEAIDALVNRRRKLMVVQRTGWGKSAVYFIATRLLRDRGRGPTLIVSPLLALMRDQLKAAERLGLRALTINSTNRKEWPELTRSILADRADVVLISPERLANETFVEEVLTPIAQRLGLLVVDEAHCISDWGHDFRPDYRRLVEVLRQMPASVPVIGTTATANDRVLDDIRQQLGDVDVQRGRLTRESLALQALRLPHQAARLAWLAAHLPDLPGTGIVYTLTKRDAEQVASWLTEQGISAFAYHSEVQSEGFEDIDSTRQHLETLLSGNRIKALVATTALGMGYDKPDLGFVIHYQAPGSIISYYQQVGRAGRAIERAVGVLLSGQEDAEIHDFFRSSSFPDDSQVEAILDALAESDGLSTREIERAVNLPQARIDRALKFLSVQSPAPLLKQGSEWVRTPVSYRMDREHIQRLTRQRQEEWREVQGYIDSPTCRMAYLAAALDDPEPSPCGRCDRCLGRPVVDEEVPHALEVAATLFLRRSEMPLECMKQVAKDGFPQDGFAGNLPKTLRAETGRVLSRWGDAGWGRAVAEDRQAGHFRDELAAAVAEMVRERWQPQPAPAWVTCVPSERNPDLVPDFARRLARQLGLPFVPAIEKVRGNEPQRLQQNRFHRCRNLDGVFVVAGALPDGPVLLVDDVVDSRWTMTIAAALLRQAGSGPVWPVALATFGGGSSGGSGD
jgi:ATP-dependent DNA helicase RecQ